MYNLYTIAKKKTGILGLWQDKEGKIYRDKIFIKEYFSCTYAFLQGKRKLFSQGDKKAFVENKDGKIDILRHRIAWNENKLKPSLVKALLVQHGGLTIFKNENDYTIEIWKA
jgi:hypothetical protein